MQAFLEHYWPYLLVVLALALLAAVLLRRPRGQRIEIVSEDDARSRRTLARPETPAPAPPLPAFESDLTRLKGVGPKLATLLGERGVASVAALAALDDASLARLDGELGSFSGRLSRDRVGEQARLLASGDDAGYEAAFGKRGGQS